MFERFAGEARQVALKAHSVAAGLGSSSVEAEHLLVSLAGTQHPAGAALREVGLEPEELHDAIQRDFERVLAQVGIDAGGLRSPPTAAAPSSAGARRPSAAWSARSRRPSAVATGARGLEISANCRRTKLRWGASAKRGLERALEEAKRRGDRRIGPEHILLGLLRAEHGTVPRLLAAEGIDRDELTGRL